MQVDAFLEEDDHLQNQGDYDESWQDDDFTNADEFEEAARFAKKKLAEKSPDCYPAA